MKQGDKKPLVDLRKIVEILLILDLVLLFLYHFIINTPTAETTCYQCRPQPVVETILIYAAIALFLAFVILSVILRYFRDIIVAGSLIVLLLLILSLWYMIYGYAWHGYACSVFWCSFNSSEFTCPTLKIQAGTSELYFKWGNSRLNHDIKVVGAKCVAAVDIPTPAYIEPLNQSILIHSGTTATIIGEGTNNTLYCKNEDGSIPADTRIGTRACLSLYINYTDAVTGESSITKASISGPYEH